MKTASFSVPTSVGKPATGSRGRIGTVVVRVLREAGWGIVLAGYVAVTLVAVCFRIRRG